MDGIVKTIPYGRTINNIPYITKEEINKTETRFLRFELINLSTIRKNPYNPNMEIKNPERIIQRSGTK
jgi:hypothetical protein